MEALYILLIPLSWLIVAKVWLRTTFDWKEFAVSFVVVTLLVVATIEISKFGMTSDTEVWNGQVTAKERDHGTYEQSYECNCTTSTDSKGNSTTTCQTCYETHYTVTWDADTTVGNVTFKHLDSTWRSVYSEPDPARYTACKVGEPAAIEHGYTNYVQAVPQSLFNDTSKVAEQFAGLVPAYPRVHDFYRINRVLNVGSTITANTVNQLNTLLNNDLKMIGGSKQANIVLILTDIADPTYRYAVENAWQGGEKNDIVLFIGLDGQKIVWADVMTWALNTGNELFHVTMRDGLMAQQILTTDIVPFITETIVALYDRPHMADYEYLADEIEVPTWVLWLAAFFAFGGSVGLTIVFHRHELFR